MSVPNRYTPDMALGQWVKNLRWEWKKLQRGEKSRLTRDRLAELERLGFVWVHDNVNNQGDEAFCRRLDDLKRFRDKYGHAMVPNRHKADCALGAWVKAQRYEMKKKKEGKKSALTDERIYLLEELGFVWSPKAKELIGTELWLKRYGELKAYQAEYGDTEVPKNHPPNKPLGNWVITQRHQRKRMDTGKKSEMTKERIQLLDEITFKWVIRKRRAKMN